MADCRDDSAQLDIDGVRTEQLLAARQRQRQEQRQRELQDLKNLHQCKQGVFCLVKQAQLSYHLTSMGHQLSYVLPVRRQNLLTMVGTVPVKISQQAGQSEGSILCQCANPECLYTLIKTLCGLKEIVPFN
ncbi:E3 14.7 protein [baboon adenovirus 1]|uniref:E3 14.7 protein n=1 Tax=Simian mastadenovirus B TaxID=1962299 RepID=M9YYZ1_9ADEN|nr:E3 14.7 protein [Simian mastadenovirus B]